MTGEPVRIDLSWRMPPVDADDPEACPTCRGTTLVDQPRLAMADGLATTVVDRVPCPTCHGLGLASEPPPGLAGE